MSGTAGSYSIIRRLLLALTLAIGAVSVAVILIFVYFGMQNGEAELEKETKKSAAYLTEILEQPLWDYDLERMQIIGGIFVKDPRVERLIIRETSGKVIFTYTHNESKADTLQHTAAITHKDRPLGEVLVEYSRASYRKQVWQLAEAGLAMSILALFVAYVTVHLLIRTLLEPPLTRLTAIVNRYAKGDYTPEGAALPYLEFQRFGTVLSEMGREIKSSQERLRKIHEELESRVTSRTAELAAVNKELESFSYSVSHDLRAPLRAIDAFSLALLEDNSAQLDEDGKKYLAIIRKEASRMGQLIDDLLNLARVSRAELKRETVDLSQLSREVINKLRAENPERMGEWIVQDGLQISADPGLMRIVMENLLSNALKFSGKQPQPKIEVGCENQIGRIVYFVRDNGAGFDMAYVGKLFGAFQRLHSMNEFDGTGIGLATVQRVIRRHGGEVWAEGALHKGAIMRFTLSNS